ncbi:transposase, partial [Sulfuriferula multivorans]
GQCYGSRRLVHALQAQGMTMGRHQVSSLMREGSFQAILT